jgi:hypothetical protein
LFSRGDFKEEPVPKIAKNLEEEKILFEAMKEARNKYPSDGK